MLHPVGPLRPVVYWRRRLGVLTLLAALGAGGWAGTELGTGRMHVPWSTAAASSPPAPVQTPALTRVATSVVASTSPACTDDVLEVVLRAPASVPAGSMATFQLVVTDTGAAPCVRSFATADQELALADAAGDRIWSSADCRASAGRDDRTLAPGQPVTLSVTWDGRTSAPGCTGPRTAPPAGSYRLQGRLATKTTAEVPVTLAT